MKNPINIKKLEIYYGGYFSDIFQLDLKGEKLIYLYGIGPVPDTTIEIIPTEKQWQSFFRSMNRITKHWKEEYYDPDITDGVQWSIEINSNVFNCSFDGSNDYPQNWDSFIRVVRRLIGNKTFGGRIP